MFTRKMFYRYAAPALLSLCLPMAASAQAAAASPPAVAPTTYQNLKPTNGLGMRSGEPSIGIN